MRFALVLAVAFAFAGCRSSPTNEPSGGGAIVIDEPIIDAAGQELGAKLATLSFDGSPTLRVLDAKNVSHNHANRNGLTDEARRRCVESNKFAVSTDPERKTDYLLQTTIHESDITFELVERASSKVILTATKGF